MGTPWLSVDSDNFPLRVSNTDEVVYQRMDGRTPLYARNYSDGEVEKILEKNMKAKPENASIYFNNDTAMLVNTRKLLDTFKVRQR